MSTARSELSLDHPLLPLPVMLRRNPRARALRLRFDAGRGVLRLTCPPRVSRRAALEWAAGQREWVDAQLAARPPGRPFVPGALVPFDGGELLLTWTAGAPRQVALDGQQLQSGGPLDGFSRRIENWLRRSALDLLSLETAALAELAGVKVRSVAVGDPATRWGSCSAAGAIRYSWRLAMAPPLVRRLVVAHEVAHRRHMDHGPAFKALEQALLGQPVEPARRLLRQLGPSLQLLGRGS